MMSQCHVALEPCLAVQDDSCGVIFLESDQGTRLPFAVGYEELENLTVALEEGQGATPPLIEQSIQWMREVDWTVARIRITGFSDDDVHEVFIDLIDNVSGRENSDSGHDLLYAVMCAIHFNVPIYVEDKAMVQWLDTAFSQEVYDALQILEETGEV